MLMPAHMDHLRYRLLEKHDADLTAGRPSEYYGPKPWDSVWSAAVAERSSDFWEQEFTIPAGLVINKLRSLSSVVKGDHPVAGASEAQFAASSALYDDSLQPPPARFEASMQNQRPPKRAAPQAIPTRSPRPSIEPEMDQCALGLRATTRRARGRS